MKLGTILQLIAFAVLLAVNGCGSSTNSYNPIVAAVTNGTLPVPASGVVTLPAQWSGLTARGTINVERRPDGRLFILFPTSYGRGDDVDGSLYCSGPLTAADFYTIDSGPGGTQTHLDACGYKMLTVGSQGSPWYSVTRRLD